MNPGSSYTDGVLQGAILDLNEKKGKVDEVHTRERLSPGRVWPAGRQPASPAFSSSEAPCTAGMAEREPSTSQNHSSQTIPKALY